MCFFLTPENFRMPARFRVPAMLQGFGSPDFLTLPSMTLTLLHRVVLSYSRFSTEGDNSKSNILLMLRLSACCCPYIFIRSDAESHWLGLMPSPEAIMVAGEIQHADGLGPGWYVPPTPEVDVELPPDHMVWANGERMLRENWGLFLELEKWLSWRIEPSDLCG